MKRLREWYERQDEYEKTAIWAFGIGCPIGLIVFGLVALLAHYLFK